MGSWTKELVGKAWDKDNRRWEGSTHQAQLWV